MIKAAFFCNQEQKLQEIYSSRHREQIAQACSLHPVTVNSTNFDQEIDALADLEVIFSTWGMPVLKAEQIARMPKLKAVFYAAGTVKKFATPFLERGVTVVSAWAANAVPVAEFTLSQILLSNKGYFRNMRECMNPSTPKGVSSGLGNNGTTISLLGAGMIGKKVIELLRPFNLRILVFDPFLSPDGAECLGVEKVELLDAFRRGMVVSNHLANVPETVGLLRREHFAAMPQGATFINTGRGATVVESDLIEVLRERNDLTALLDVTDPEPPTPDSQFHGLPNVFRSGHIAGASGNEVWRMSDLVLEEFESWRNGRNLRYAVTLEMLKTMA